MKICSSLRYQVSGWVFCFFTEEYLEPFKGLKISCSGSFVCETEEASKILERIKQERSEASRTDGGHRAGRVSTGLLFCAHIKVPLCDWQPPFWPVVRRGLGGSRKKICLLVHPCAVYVQVRGDTCTAVWLRAGPSPCVACSACSLVLYSSLLFPSFGWARGSHVNVKICSVTYSPRCTRLIAGAAMPKSLFMGFVAN